MIICWIFPFGKYLGRDTFFHTCPEVEVRVGVARIGRDIEFIHLDKVEAVTVAATRFRFEKPHLHRKCNWIVAEDEELWIVYEYLIVKLCSVGEEEKD